MKRFYLGSLLAITGLMLLLACGGPKNGLSAAERESLRQRQLRMEQQVSALRQQLATLDKQLTDLRAVQDNQMTQVLAASQALNNQLTDLRNELSTSPSGTLEAPARATPAARDNRVPPQRSAWDVILWVFITAALLGAVFFLIKFLYGRVKDEEDEDLDPADEEYRTSLGTVTVSPAAQATMQDAPGAYGHVAPPAQDPKIPAEYVPSAVEETILNTPPAPAPDAPVATPLETAIEDVPNDLNVIPEPGPRRRKS